MTGYGGGNMLGRQPGPTLLRPGAPKMVPGAQSQRFRRGQLVPGGSQGGQGFGAPGIGGGGDGSGTGLLPPGGINRGQGQEHGFGLNAGQGRIPGGNPAQPGSGGGQPPGQPPGNDSPGPPALDAQYYLNVLANQFKTNNQVNALNEQGGYADTALQGALAQLAYQQPRAQLRAEQAANQRGGLYSSVENQTQGDLAYGYLGREGALINNAARSNAARQSQIAGLQGGSSLYDMGQYLAAAQRQSVLAQKNPALGQSQGPLVPSSQGQGPIVPPAGHTGHGSGHSGGQGGRGRQNQRRLAQKLATSPGMLGGGNPGGRGRGRGGYGIAYGGG